jgi:GT2 family glycosyltransferase
MDNPMSTSTLDRSVTEVPATVLDVELSEALPRLSGVDGQGRRVRQAWLLVRMFTEPLGLLVVDLPEHGLGPIALARAIDAEFGPALRDRLRTGTYLATREEILRTAPPITVVICTRDRPRALATCLDAVLAQQYPNMRVLVVDNAPATHATADVVRAAARRGPVEYLLAPRPGLSNARNAAVAAAPGQILAWTDDDVAPDPYWLSEVARALAAHPEADVVCGAVVPAELETPAQLWFEEFGGHSKGRGFTPAVFSPATADQQSPLYPLPAFGVGANMVFRPGVIERIGGFDPALGAGTPAMGSEDTLAFTQVLRQGGTIVYQPTALVRHYHRRDLDSLYRQMVGYGTGLTAAFTSLVRSDPRVLWPLLRLAPTALRDLFGAGSLRVAGLGPDFPRKLLAANRRGMLRGPLAYFRGRR